MMSRVLSPHQFGPIQHDGVDGPLGSYGDPGPVGVGWQGTGTLGAEDIGQEAGI